MAKLNEYLGSIISSVTNARVMADIQSVKVAQEYARHDLLKHFAIPRMRIGEVELTIPVAVDALTQRTETRYQPIDNQKFSSLLYKELTASLGRVSLPLKASQHLRSQLSKDVAQLEQQLNITQDLSILKSFSEQLSRQLLGLCAEYQLQDAKQGEMPTSEVLAARFEQVAQREVKDLGQKQVLDQLEVIAESHRLKEQKPEHIIYIKMKIAEDGMEWQQIEQSDGQLSQRLLPE